MDETQEEQLLRLVGQLRTREETAKPVSQPSDKARTIAELLNESEPYNIFFNLLPGMKPNSNSITFADLLHPSLGEIVAVLHIYRFVDLKWLMNQYEECNIDHAKIDIICNIMYNNDLSPMQKNIVNHDELEEKIHGKVTIFKYMDDSVRFVIGSGNLTDESWTAVNTMQWISPICKKLHENGVDGDTKFKASMIRFLQSFPNRIVDPILDNWIKVLQPLNTAHLTVFLITSQPQKYKPNGDYPLCQVANIISNFCKVTTHSDIHIQTSSIGMAHNWLFEVLVPSLFGKTGVDCRDRHEMEKLHIIYPTVKDVITADYKCTPFLTYSKTVYPKQKFLNKYLHSWKSSDEYRNKCLPFTSSYCAISGDRIKYMLLFLNMSRSSWGGVPKNNQVLVRTYECGLLFVPKMFNKDHFITSEFPLLYKLPLNKYTMKDEPYAEKKFE